MQIVAILLAILLGGLAFLALKHKALGWILIGLAFIFFLGFLGSLAPEPKTVAEETVQEAQVTTETGTTEETATEEARPAEESSKGHY